MHIPVESCNYIKIWHACRYPDEEAGQLPMAVVVRQSKSTLGEPEVMDFVAKQVRFTHIPINFLKIKVMAFYFLLSFHDLYQFG